MRARPRASEFRSQGSASVSAGEASSCALKVSNLVALVDEAGIPSDQILIYAADRAALNSAQRVVASFFALLHFIWESRACLSHINANLELGAPYLRTALHAFERAHWRFQRMCCRPYCLV